MSLDAAAFLVNRGGTNYFCQGKDLADRLQVGDKVLVQRNGQRFTATYADSDWNAIQDDDLLLAWDGSNNRRVTGLNFKTLFGPKEKPTLEGFGITSDKAVYNYNGLIQATFTGMKPGYTREDYTQAYETVSRLSTAATPHVDLRLAQGTENFSLAAHWKYELLPVTVQKSVELYLDFIDRETRVKTSYSMIATLKPRSQEEEEQAISEAQECHRLCYQEYQRCKLLCETDYCLSICDAQFEECVASCYEDKGLSVPLLLIPPPRA